MRLPSNLTLWCYWFQKKTKSILSWGNCSRGRKVKENGTSSRRFCYWSSLLSETREGFIYTKVLGAVVAHLSNPFLFKNVDVRNDLSRHNERLRRIIRKGNIQEPHDQIFLQNTLTNGIQTCFHLVGVEYLSSDERPSIYQDIDVLKAFIWHCRSLQRPI